MNDNSIRFNTSKSSRSSDDNDTSTTGPTGSPSSSTDFKKVVAKGSRDERDSSGKKDASAGNKKSANTTSKDLEDLTAEEQAALAVTSKPSLSLFDLAQGADESGVGSISKLKKSAAGMKSQKTDADQSQVNLDAESPSDLFKRISSKAIHDSVVDEFPGTNLQGLTQDDLANKGNASQFTQEQPDMSYVNPLNLGMQTPSAMSLSDVNPMQASNSAALRLKEIVDQIIDKLYTLTVDGRTDTVMTIKNNALFAGANIILSSFESAKGEFNITFENLSPQAKRLLDMQETQNSLRLALEEKGYGVHIITATTTIESQPIAESETQQQLRRDDQSGDQQQEQENRDEENI